MSQNYSHNRDRRTENSVNRPSHDWNFSLEQVVEGNAHATKERRELLTWAFRWCATHGIRRETLASAVGYDPTKVYQIFCGKYYKPGTREPYDIPQKFHQALKAWRLDQMAGALEEGLDGLEWVDTSISKRMTEALNLARESRSPVFVYGASHIGKTQAASRWVTQNNHGQAVHFRLPSSGGRKAMLSNIAMKLGRSTKGTSDDLVLRVKKAVDPEMTLVFDEVHGLTLVSNKKTFFQCIEDLREIWDHTHCGMVFVATSLDRSVFEEERKGELQQISRRGVHVYELGDEVPFQDVAAILDHYGIEMPEPKDQIQIGGITEQPYDCLRQIAKEHGIKAITERIRYAKKFADRSGETLALAHFVRAHLTIASNARKPRTTWK